MDPDPDAEAETATAQLLKKGCITIALSACYYYQAGTKNKMDFSHFPAKIPAGEEKKAATIPKKKKNTIYLTFDDGPNKGSRKVVDIINEEKVPVTMFVVGEHVYGSREQKNNYDSILQCRYIEIANHSFTHAGNRFTNFYAVPDSVVNDFIRCTDSLHLARMIIRTPGRNIWRTDSLRYTDIKTSIAAADSLQQKGFTAIGWDLEWHFDKALNLECNSDEMVAQVDSLFSKGQTKTAGHLVLLAHDQVYADAPDSTELHAFIDKLKRDDQYDFDSISNYPGIKKQLTP